MRHKQYCIIFAALFPLYGLPFSPSLALECGPSKTWTTGPDDEAGFVLAEGVLSAVRIAGPFEVPWAMTLLPDARSS
jgi:hypothetical protein